MKAKKELQVCIFGEDGDIIVQISDKETELTVRNPGKEEKASVTLTPTQAQMLSEIISRSSDIFVDEDDD